MPGAFGCIPSCTPPATIAGSTSTVLPRTSLRSSTVMAPGLRSVGTSPVRSTIVDSTPIPTGPSSRIISMRPFRSWRTCSASVGLGFPEVLALGPAMGRPEALIKERVSLFSGHLMATVLRPPVVSIGTMSAFGMMMVRGPGQKLSISFFASSGNADTRGSTSSIHDTCTMRGLSEGRPFASYIFRLASGSRALPPSPYTVSVGNATSPPLLIMSAAC